MALRALPVVTKLTQLGFGRAERAVTISTVSPLLSVVFSGTSRRAILAALQRFPMSVCTA